MSYRAQYTEMEHIYIFEYIKHNKGYKLLKGNKFWKEMESNYGANLPTRTWQSLKEHFRRAMYPKLDQLQLEMEEIERIRKGYQGEASSTGKSEPISVGSDKDLPSRHEPIPVDAEEREKLAVADIEGLSLLTADASIPENQQSMEPPTAPQVKEESLPGTSGEHESARPCTVLKKQYLHPGKFLAHFCRSKLKHCLFCNTINNVGYYEYARPPIIIKKEIESVPIFTDNTELPLINLKFLLINFKCVENGCIKRCITKLGGKVVSKHFEAIIDYAVVPKFCSKLTEETVTHVVTEFFISECFTYKSLLPVEYYHEPILVVNNKVLEQCVISLSEEYSGLEKLFLQELIIELGATFQKIFARRAVPDTTIVTSTHLVCSKCEGYSYEAAVRWSVPVIDKNWLLESALGVFVNVNKFLLGSEEHKEDKEDKGASKNDEPEPIICISSDED